MGNTKVLLADDHTIVRQGLRSLLEKENWIDVIGEAEDGIETVKKAEKLCPDVVVIDIAMPIQNGLEATIQIKKRFPEIKVIVLTAHSNEEYIFQSLKAGASGYLVKSAAPSELISAIQAALKGETFLSSSVSRVLIDEYVKRTSKMSGKVEPFEMLTHREKQVLQLIAEGKKIREIAEILFVSGKTIETHKANIKKKLKIRTTAEMVRYAMHKGLIAK
jgi:DNA-binding NarL/FixJ family response regulator